MTRSHLHDTRAADNRTGDNTLKTPHSIIINVIIGIVIIIIIITVIIVTTIIIVVVVVSAASDAVRTATQQYNSTERASERRL